MNKMADLLENLGRQLQSSFGFAPVDKVKKVPDILIGWHGDSVPIEDGEILADFVILPPKADGTPNLKPPKEDVLWGCTAKEFGATFTAQTLKDAEASFVIATSDKLPASILTDEEVCTGYVLPSDKKEETHAKAVDAHGFDFLVLDTPYNFRGRMTLAETLEMQKVTIQYSTHIFLNTSSLPDPSDLQIIQDLPISALLIGKECEGLDMLQGIRKAIAEMEVRKRPSYALPSPQIQDFDSDNLND